MKGGFIVNNIHFSENVTLNLLIFYKAVRLKCKEFYEVSFAFIEKNQLQVFTGKKYYIFIFIKQLLSSQVNSVHKN